MHRKSWKPGTLHPNLSWTHYRTLLRVDKVEARAFYEIEAIKNNWAARELERQIQSEPTGRHCGGFPILCGPPPGLPQ